METKDLLSILGFALAVLIAIGGAFFRVGKMDSTYATIEKVHNLELLVLKERNDSQSAHNQLVSRAELNQLETKIEKKIDSMMEKLEAKLDKVLDLKIHGGAS